MVGRVSREPMEEGSMHLKTAIRPTAGQPKVENLAKAKEAAKVKEMARAKEKEKERAKAKEAEKVEIGLLVPKVFRRRSPMHR